MKGQDGDHGREIVRHLGAEILGCTLLEVIGVGSCAVVYRGVWRSGEEVVVKIAHAHLLEPRYGDRIRARFHTEFEAASRLSHQHLIKIHAVGETAEGAPALVMEYVPGRTLRQVLAERAPLNARQAAKMGLSLASALRALHEVGVIHRDVNPNNILSVRTQDSARSLLKLIDLGVARVDGAGPDSIGPVGTPLYMAPEQLYGQSWPASDIYSLGAILWWALTGHEYRRAQMEQDALFQVETGELIPPDPRHEQPEVPEELALLVQQCLAIAPRRRPAAGEIYWRLKRSLVGDVRATRRPSNTLPQLNLGELLGAAEPPSLVEPPSLQSRPLFAHRSPPHTPSPPLPSVEDTLQALAAALASRALEDAALAAAALREQALALGQEAAARLAEAMIALCRARDAEQADALLTILTRACAVPSPSPHQRAR